MQETVLNRIVADKALWVEARKQQQPLASFQNEIVPATRNFYHALQGGPHRLHSGMQKSVPV
ncbi:Tryptophan biosynthesis protein TrpCF [Cedecea neteri]|uniref:Tryptophan biosynthesis protein TrpCF n=1 Tax=Cedecea neteri TaxID=158822 RepID=A0A2X3IZ62_9ENTR|nr:Tryptophan biosynthesis protein TrpCF [Cedecea neteri]